MLEIMVAPGRSGLLSNSLLHSMFQLRKSIFLDRLRWNVQSHAGQERDPYDNMNPIYLVAFESSSPEVALGCWRLLPTTGPYMLKDVFAPLLGSSLAPVLSAVWEVSRFATARISSEHQFGFGVLATAMLRSLWCQAKRQRLSEIVGVSSMPVERMLTRLGFRVDRFSPPSKFGTVRSVAFSLPILDNVERAVFSGTAAPSGTSMAWRAKVGRYGELLAVVDLEIESYRVVA